MKKSNQKQQSEAEVSKQIVKSLKKVKEIKVIVQKKDEEIHFLLYQTLNKVKLSKFDIISLRLFATLMCRDLENGTFEASWLIHKNGISFDYQTLKKVA